MNIINCVFYNGYIAFFLVQLSFLTSTHMILHTFDEKYSVGMRRNWNTKSCCLL